MPRNKLKIKLFGNTQGLLTSISGADCISLMQIFDHPQYFIVHGR